MFTQRVFGRRKNSEVLTSTLAFNILKFVKDYGELRFILCSITTINLIHTSIVKIIVYLYINCYNSILTCL